MSGKGSRDARKRAELERRLLAGTPEGRLLDLMQQQESQRASRATRTRKRPTSVSVTHNPLGVKLKSTCCDKNPRCINCPIVYAKLQHDGAWEKNDITLAQELRRARRVSTSRTTARRSSPR